MALQLDALMSSTMNEGCKGLPAGAAGIRLNEVAEHHWHLLNEDLPLPAAVIKQSALQHNAQWMRDFLQQSDVLLAPHGKTTMCPQLFNLQLEHGAWGITVATVQHLRVCRRYGVSRILMANQLVGADDIRYIAAELARDPDFEFYCLVDSIAGVQRLQHALSVSGPGVTLRVLLEVGISGGRTGCRTTGQALDVAAAVVAQPQLRLCGVECYEGGLVSDDAGGDASRVEQLIQRVVEVYRQCRERVLFDSEQPVILSAGGSAYFDIVASIFKNTAFGDSERSGVKSIVRSGCYLTHDSAFYQRLFERVEARCNSGTQLSLPKTGGLKAALEIWAYVQSTPEPGLAILNLGKRDISHDIDLPVVEQWFRPGAMAAPQKVSAMTVTALNDQHAYLSVPASASLRVGDMVALGISHPCTTFDKWRLLWMVDDNYQVVAGLKTCF